jgi:hypothetical protein
VRDLFSFGEGWGGLPRDRSSHVITGLVPVIPIV